ncbi:VOC family protein [Paenibacillus nasutitermitis]|uniref:Extradiol dioxygenase n=1 Tax=Paenibacillus nasutitermitis TaxID=1652958 RepID=A0A916YS50_9BACL|nr:VOC family protein [Paenibacillus nasutitermitis]GGD57452.1 extradiol dioxygenase [Paenibacillus nasutitermitis]
MALTADQIFVNLPVKDLNKAVEFFRAVGFDFNPQFTDENATCMIVSDKIFVMLLVENFYKTFTSKEIANTATTNEVIIALSAESREEVDAIVNRALEAGGKPYNEPVDHGFMYSWSFQDVDGHLWEFTHMDANALNPEQGQA